MIGKQVCLYYVRSSLQIAIVIYVNNNKLNSFIEAIFDCFNIAINTLVRIFVKSYLKIEIIPNIWTASAQRTENIMK